MFNAVSNPIRVSYRTNKLYPPIWIYQLQWASRGSEAIPEPVSQATGGQAKIFLQPLTQRIFKLVQFTTLKHIFQCRRKTNKRKVIS